jgi:hypothetical protein
VECNGEQLGVLSSEIARTLDIDVRPILIDELKRASRIDLDGIRLFLTTDYHVQEVRQVADRFKKPVLNIRLNVEFFKGLERELKKGRLLFVVKDPEFHKIFPQALEKLIPPQYVRNLSIVTCDQEQIVKEAFSLVQTIHIAPSCPPQVRASILKHKPPHISLFEVSRFVSRESITYLRNVLTLC